MKKIKFISLILAVIMLLQFPITAYAETETYSPYVKGTYLQQEKMQNYTIVHGLDLSYHNGTVDFAKLAAQGVKYVILRVGYRGYGESAKLVYDTKYDEFYASAKAAGLEVGTYFYSQALNTTEAAAEANYMLDKIRDQKMDLPVYYDYEFADVSDGRLDVAWKNGTVTKAMMTANVNAFCEVIKNAGYVPGLYSSTDFLNNKYNINDINKDISIWNAHYTSKNSSTGKYAATGFTGDYEMWQYSSKGQVYGVHLEKGDNTDGSKYYDVDCNFLYRELMDAKMNGSQFAMSTIKDQAYTGSEVTPKFTLYYQGKELVKDKDYTVVFSDNIKIGTAKITITGINDYAEAGVWVQSFKIVPTKVENLTLTGQTTTSVSFKWDAHPDATRYRVQTYKNNKWKTYKDTKNTYFSITGLSPGETVKVRVGPIKTINSVDYVGKSCDGVDMTAAPEKVISIKNTVKSVNTIKLTWKKFSYVSYYNVYLYNTSTKAYDYVCSTKENHAEFYNLKKNSAYKYKIRAVLSLADGTKVYGDKSNAYTAYTYPAKPTLNSVKKAKKKKKLTVKWKKVSGVSGYQVQWSTNKSFSKNKKSVYVSYKNASKTITTAKSKKKYYVRVRAYKTLNGKKVYSYWSTTKSAKTK